MKITWNLRIPHWHTTTGLFTRILWEISNSHSSVCNVQAFREYYAMFLGKPFSTFRKDIWTSWLWRWRHYDFPSVGTTYPPSAAIYSSPTEAMFDTAWCFKHAVSKLPRGSAFKFTPSAYNGALSLALMQSHIFAMSDNQEQACFRTLEPRRFAVNNFPTFYGTRSFITVYSTAHEKTLSHLTRIWSTDFHTFS